MIGMVKGTTRQIKQVAGLPAPIASFTSNIKGNLPSLKVAVTAQQASGTPTPSNPLPITGWNGANVTRTGKNVWGGLVMANSFSDGVDQYSLDTVNKFFTFTRSNNTSASYRTVLFTDFKPNTQYTLILSCKLQTSGTNSSLRIYYTDDTNTAVSITNTDKDHVIVTSTSGKSVASITLSYYSTTKTQVYYEESGLFEGVLTADDFEPYNGITVTIPFGDTYYGGELDVTNGVLTVTHGKVKISELSWNRNAQYNVYYAYINGKAVDYDNFLCDSYKVVRKSFQTLSNGEISGTNVNNGINIKDDDFSDAQTFVQSRGNVEIVYELATPIEIQLTPQQIAQLLGENNVFADCGDINELKYNNIVVTALFSKG